MLCQNCKKHPATVHLTEITDGQRFEMHLCQECAKKQGLALQSQIPLNELLSTLLSQSAMESEQADISEQPSEGAVSGQSCPVCGTDYAKFKENRVLGCPNDYEALDSFLKPIIKSAQRGNLKHIGKVPSRVPEDTRRQLELMRLQKQLDEAVKQEDYETAAHLRDEIERLK